MNQALFAVELYDNSWDFGDVVFKNVELIASNSDTSWCTSTPQYSSVTINVQGVASYVDGSGYAHCTMSSVTLSPP